MNTPAPIITRTAGTDEYGVYVTVSGDLPKDDPEHGKNWIAKRVYLDGDEDGDEASIVLAEDSIRFTLKARAVLLARAEGGAA